MGTLPRTLNPALNAPGYMAAAAAVYAAATMVYNAVNHHGVWNAGVLVAAVTAVASLLTRQRVTPVADPRDGNGTPLTAAPAPPLPPPPAGS
jgi:hypothetical protein